MMTSGRQDVQYRVALASPAVVVVAVVGVVTEAGLITSPVVV
jgi:hypothetical protein